MKLHVQFDDSLMKRYTERGSNPLFVIYWTHGGDSYPDQDWTDFGTVVLSWWLREGKELLAGADQAELDFMDGPYSLTLCGADDFLSVSASGLEKTWTVSKREFLEELISAAESVAKKLTELGLPDTNGIEDGLVSLRIDATAPPRRKILVSNKIA